LLKSDYLFKTSKMIVYFITTTTENKRKASIIDVRDYFPSTYLKFCLNVNTLNSTILKSNLVV